MWRSRIAGSEPARPRSSQCLKDRVPDVEEHVTEKPFFRHPKRESDPVDDVAAQKTDQKPSDHPDAPHLLVNLVLLIVGRLVSIIDVAQAIRGHRACCEPRA